MEWVNGLQIKLGAARVTNARQLEQEIHCHGGTEKILRASVAKEMAEETLAIVIAETTQDQLWLRLNHEVARLQHSHFCIQHSYLNLNSEW
jgi:hypothetical protein